MMDINNDNKLDSQDLYYLLLYIAMHGAGIKATWSITKIIVNIVFLPLVIIGLFVSGLAYAALIVLAIVGIVSLIKDHM
jgi:hypothetical protein